ncbi:hypothetical protein [Scytonema sp. NUACC26]
MDCKIFVNAIAPPKGNNCPSGRCSKKLLLRYREALTALLPIGREVLVVN